VAAAIAEAVPLDRTWEVLDFGCGTGLVTLALAPRVGSITGADTSLGMLEELGRKAAAQRVPVHRVELDPAGTDLGGPYDLITSSMTLHHVKDVKGLFRTFAAHLKPGGRVALADLDLEDGSFHGDLADVFHKGFDRERIQAWLEAAGFREVRVGDACVTEKDARRYPVFLATGHLG
jgi:2-polyprenyl-3-methyl-5-hydroxy-6-metoxy-1,4-benzoquinol methylase